LCVAETEPEPPVQAELAVQRAHFVVAHAVPAVVVVPFQVEHRPTVQVDNLVLAAQNVVVGMAAVVDVTRVVSVLLSYRGHNGHKTALARN